MRIELSIIVCYLDTRVPLILYFLEGGHIFSYYLLYSAINIYVYEIFRYRIELRRLLVLLIFLVPLFMAFLVFGSLNSSVDFYYLLKSSGLRLYVFSSIISYGLVLKDWSIFLILFFFYV